MSTVLGPQACLLAIDTSTEYLSLGLLRRDQTYTVYEAVGNRQSEQLLPAIGQLLTNAAVSWPQLDAIVYAQGPGAFTGLRIGLSVAQGLAAPWELPLIGIPCLDAVAALRPDQDCVLAATDARMGELFYAWYDTRQQQRLGDYRVGPATDIRLPEGRTSACGVGNAYALDPALPVPGTTQMPTAREYLQLALSGTYAATEASGAELLYVRNKIALTAAEQAARKQGATC